jgi:hypothetical protein
MHASSPSPSAVAAPSPTHSKGEPSIAPEGAETVAWTTHAARRSPGRIAFALAVIAVTWWIALAAFQSPLMAVVGCLAILGSVAEGLFPVHHRLTQHGASTRCAWQMRTLAWENVKTARAGKDGMHLSPLPSGSRLGRVRGVTLRFPDADGPDVLALSRRYLTEARARRPHPQ